MASFARGERRQCDPVLVYKRGMAEIAREPRGPVQETIPQWHLLEKAARFDLPPLIKAILPRAAALLVDSFSGQIKVRRTEQVFTQSRKHRSVPFLSAIHKVSNNSRSLIDWGLLLWKIGPVDNAASRTRRTWTDISPSATSRASPNRPITVIPGAPGVRQGAWRSSRCSKLRCPGCSRST